MEAGRTVSAASSCSGVLTKRCRRGSPVSALVTCGTIRASAACGSAGREVSGLRLAGFEKLYGLATQVVQQRCGCERRAFDIQCDTGQFVGRVSQSSELCREKLLADCSILRCRERLRRDGSHRDRADGPIQNQRLPDTSRRLHTYRLLAGRQGTDSLIDCGIVGAPDQVTRRECARCLIRRFRSATPL